MGPQLNSNMLSFAAISAIVAVSYAQSSSDEIILQCRANSIVDVSADADYADGAAAALERARVLVRGVNKEGEDFEEAFGKAETGVDISLNIVEQNVEQGVNGQFTATVARDSCEDLMNVDSANPWVNTENVAIWADTEVQNGEFENNIRESWVEGVILKPASAQSIVIADENRVPILCCPSELAGYEGEDGEFFTLVDQLLGASAETDTETEAGSTIAIALSAAVAAIAAKF